MKISGFCLRDDGYGKLERDSLLVYNLHETDQKMETMDQPCF